MIELICMLIGIGLGISSLVFAGFLIAISLTKPIRFPKDWEKK